MADQLKVVFAPGCFDEFEGTQEELDELIAKIQTLAESGEIAENAIELEDLDPEDQLALEEYINQAGNEDHILQ